MDPLLGTKSFERITLMRIGFLKKQSPDFFKNKNHKKIHQKFLVPIDNKTKKMYYLWRYYRRK